MGLANKSLSVFIRDGFLFFSNAVVSIILARSLGPHFLGLWFALNLIPSYAELFGRIKIDVAAVYFLSKGKYTIDQVIPIINLFAIVFSLIIGCIYILFSGSFNAFLFKEFAKEMSGFALLILLQIPVTFIYMNYLYIHIYRENEEVVNRMVLMRSLVSFLIIAASFILSSFKLSIITVLIATFAGILLALIYGIYEVQKHKFISLNPIKSITKDLFSYGSQLYVTGILSYFNIYVIQFLVLAFLMPIQMSFYTIAQQNSQLFQKLSDAISVFFFPLITKNDNMREKLDITFKIFRVLLTMLLPSLVLAFIFLRPLVELTYGIKYLSIVIPVFIMLPCIVLATSISPVLTLFQSCGKPQLASKSLIIPVTLQLIAGFFFIPKGGVIAAALCFALGSVTASITQLYILKDQFEIENLLSKLIIRKADVHYVWSFAISIIRRKN